MPQSKQCQICLKEFNQTSDLRRHIQAIHNGVRHNCNVCGHEAKSKSNLKRHINSVHKDIKEACDECYKPFSQSTLWEHKKSDKVKHKCD